MFIKPSPEQIALVEEYKEKVKTCTLNQEQFLSQFKDTDPLKNYFTTLNGGIASQKGMTAALNKTTISSKLAAAGMTTLGVAMNMALTMGVAILIQAVVVGIQKLITAQQDAIDAATELQEAYQEQSDKLKGNIDSIKGLEAEFKKLSAGVDDYGNNISLSSDEYSRYQKIVEQIVGISPELIAGYDDEGNAIAKKNGLVERAIELQNIEYQNRLREITDHNSTKEVAKGSVATYSKAATDYSVKSAPSNELVSAIQYSSPQILELLGLEKEWEDFNRRMRGQASKSTFISQNLDEIMQKIKESNDYFGGEISVDAYSGIMQSFKAYEQGAGNFERQLARASKSFNAHLMLSLQTADGYSELSDAQKNFLQEYVNAFKITGQTTEKDLVKIQQDYISFAEELSTNDVAKNAINDFFALDKNKLSANEWTEEVNRLISDIANALGEDSDDLKLKLGVTVETNQDEIVNTVSKMVEEVSAKLNISPVDVGSLSIKDLELVYANLANTSVKSIDQLIWKIDQLKSVNESTSLLPQTLDESNKQLDDLQAKYQALANTISDYNSSGIMTIDNMQSLINLGADYLQYLSIENGQLKLNKDGIIALALARIDDAEASFLQDSITLIQSLKDEKSAADYLKTSTEELAKARTTDASARWEQASAEAAKKAAESGNTQLIEAVDKARAAVDAGRMVFDKARDSIGKYTDATMGAADATKKLAEEQQKQLEANLRAEGEAAIRVIDRKIKAIQDAQKASEKAIDSQIDDIKREKEAYEKAIDAEIKKLNERKKALEDSIAKYEDAAGAVVDLIGEQLDAIDGKKDDINKFYDEQLEALDKTNKALQDQIDREKALEELEKAKNQQVRIFKDGKLQYVGNETEIKEKQDAYDQLIADQTTQAEKDRLEQERDDKLTALDEEAKRWEEYKKLWQDATTAYEREQQLLHAMEVLGAQWEQDILNQRTDVLDKFTEDHYNQTVELENNVLTQIETLTKQKEEEALIFEERIAALEEQKKQEAANYAERIEYLNGYKEQIQDKLSIIGKTWDEYQQQLDFEAKWEAKLYDGMASAVEDYADRVEDAMRRAQVAKASGGAGGFSGGSGSNSSSGSGSKNNGVVTGGGSNSDKKYTDLDKNKLDRLASGGVAPRTDVYHIDELSPELILRKPENGRFKLLEMGDMVIRGDMSKQFVNRFMSSPGSSPEFTNQNPVASISNVNNASTVIQINGNLSFPNIHSGNDVDKLIDGLTRLSLDAMQRRGKKQGG